MDISKKKITAKEAMRFVKSGMMIVTGLGAAEGRAFLSELHTIADHVSGVTVTNCLPMSNQPFYDKMYKHSFYVDGWFYSPSLRKGHSN
jgi:acyl-CoA hydrolase